MLCWLQKGEVIRYLMRRDTCLASSVFSLQVFCNEDQDTALLLVQSSAMINEVVMSRILGGIAHVEVSQNPPPTSAAVPEGSATASPGPTVFTSPFIALIAATGVVTLLSMIIVSVSIAW